jgi:hypothetical protein
MKKHCAVVDWINLAQERDQLHIRRGTSLAGQLSAYKGKKLPLCLLKHHAIKTYDLAEV